MSQELKVHYYLRHKELKNDGSAPIMGRITIGKSMVQFSAKCSVQVSLWDTKSARATGKSKVAAELNRILDQTTLSIHSHYKDLLAKKRKSIGRRSKERLSRHRLRAGNTDRLLRQV
ncbi:Arm DNA-binding domain-containing protein [Bacteroides fragilis]